MPYYRYNFSDSPSLSKEVLGLTPKSLRKNFVNFEWYNLKLSISVHEKVIDAAKDPFRIMINLESDDIFSIYNDLLTKGVQFIREPEDESWGFVASFYDPDGNILQLIQNHKTN